LRINTACQRRFVIGMPQPAKSLSWLSIFVWLVATPLHAQDAKAVVEQAIAAITRAKYSVRSRSMATAFDALFGQAYDGDSAWPRFALTRFSLAINYPDNFLRDERTRVQAQNPPLGGETSPSANRGRPCSFVTAARGASVVEESPRRHNSNATFARHRKPVRRKFSSPRRLSAGRPPCGSHSPHRGGRGQNSDSYLISSPQIRLPWKAHSTSTIISSASGPGSKRPFSVMPCLIPSSLSIRISMATLFPRHIVQSEGGYRCWMSR